MIGLIFGIIIIFILNAILKELRLMKQLLLEKNIQQSKDIFNEAVNTEVSELCPDCGTILSSECYVCPSCGAEFEEN